MPSETEMRIKGGRRPETPPPVYSNPEQGTQLGGVYPFLTAGKLEAVAAEAAGAIHGMMSAVGAYRACAVLWQAIGECVILAQAIPPKSRKAAAAVSEIVQATLWQQFAVHALGQWAWLNMTMHFGFRRVRVLRSAIFIFVARAFDGSP